MASDALEVVGLVLLVAAGFMLATALGVALAGGSCLLAGFALDRKGAE